MTTHRVSAALLLLVALLTVAKAVTGLEPLAAAAVVALLVFLALEFARVPRLQKRVGTALLSAGLVTAGLAAVFADASLFEMLYGGLTRTLPFLLLFASVGWLQSPSAQSPSLLAIRESVLRQPPGRRFASVALVAHFLGVAFNLAGLSLLTPMVSRGSNPHLQKRLGRAMMQGFSAGTCWSPFYVGTAVIIASVPGVDWIKVAPTGMLLALVLLVWSWLVDRIFARPARGPATPPADAATLSRAALGNAGLILVSLFACVIALVEGLGWSIPIALAVTAPLYALLWSFFIQRASANAGKGPLATAKSVLNDYPRLRGEALLFTGANLLGVGISGLLPQATIAAWVGGLAPTPGLALFVLMGGCGLTSALGLHPVVVVVLVTSVMTPEMIGLPPELFALALMVMWGQGTNASPFSATVLYMARLTGASGLTIAWVWSAPFVATTILLLATLLTAINALGIY